MTIINSELKEKNEEVIKYDFKAVVGDSLKNLEKTKNYSKLPVTSRPITDFGENRMGNKYFMEHHLKSGIGLQLFTKQDKQSSKSIYFLIYRI